MIAFEMGQSPQYVAERHQRHVRDHRRNECDACEFCLNARAWRRRLGR